VRRTLDSLYLACGYAAAVFLVAIAGTIIAQIVGRFLGVAVDSTETAGFCLAASTFFGLAYTFRYGGHIRVTLLVGRTSGRLRRAMDLWCIGFCAAAVGYFAYWAADFVYYSFVFREISPGLLAIPFWIPRSAMALGLAVLFVALVDEFVTVARGAVPSFEANAEPVVPPSPAPATGSTHPESLLSTRETA